MASTSFAGLLLLLVLTIILIGIQYSTANVDGSSTLHNEYHTLRPNERTITSGRKMLQGIEGKTGSNKPAGAEELEEKADKVANLMRKDYKGVPRRRRKPPIHNNEPRNR